MTMHVVIAGKLNMRKEAAASASVVAILPFGAILTETAPVKDDWLGVATEQGLARFVLAKFTTPGDAAQPGALALADLQKLAPTAKPAVLEPLAENFGAVRKAAGLASNNLHICHFLAQICHESGGFRFMREIWGPTAAQLAYEGKASLGNTEPGDGKRFLGRGYLQITGRANYKKFGNDIGLGDDLVVSPALAEDPVIALKLACAYWKTRAIDTPAGKDDIVAVTKKVNGGTNGLTQRIALFKLARTIWP